MAEFDQIRDELVALRRKLDRHRQEELLAREAVKKAERPGLESTLKSAQARAEEAGRQLAEHLETEGKLLAPFQAFTDPRQGLRRLPGGYPVLLFPLRLETRFKTGEAEQPQLWVRVFPDTCLVDSFEASLTEQELTNARVFWAAIWRAGGDEALERAAWRDLVAAHGSGRAGWIVRRYMPLNPNDKPVKDNATDVLLIITAPGPLPTAASAYWEAVWRAEGNAAAEQDAFAALKDATADLDPEQAQRIAQDYWPFNLSDAPTPPRTRADVQVKVAVLQLTPPEDIPTRRTSWSSASRVDLLPERFLLVAYPRSGEPLVEISRPVRTPLIVGPDPTAPPKKQLKQKDEPDDDTLQTPDELAWMFDFERALEVGMALRVDLTPTQAKAGFERVIVLGVRFGDTPESGQENLERLIEHHLYSRPGLEILPQGTPTNKTEKGGSGYSFRENPDVTFDVFFQQRSGYRPQYRLESDPLLRSDGQWLAELLGLRHDLVQRIPNASGSDQSEARAMQIALWPGTLGYMMQTLLTPVFPPQDIADTRDFFTRYVSERGPLPALRIGAQPYGILPTTAFDGINWFGTGEPVGFLGRLYAILKRITADWKPLVERVSHVGKRGGDPHQILLDVLGLHPTSVEYYSQQAESIEHKYYEISFFDPSIAQNLLGLVSAMLPLTLLSSFGYVGEEALDLLNKVYRALQTPLDGPLIDDRPLSEDDPIREYAGDWNYIEWLVDAAQTGIERIQQEQGFNDGKKPTALLYLLLRHALQLSFHATGVRLQARAAGEADTRARLREPAFVHVREAQGSESRYDVLFRPDERITGRTDLPVGDYIRRRARTARRRNPSRR